MKEKIRARARSLNIKQCGFTTYEERCAIVCLFPYFNGYNNGNLSLYAQSIDYHLIVKEKLTILKKNIEEICPRTHCDIFCDIGPHIDRHLAYRAGLGFYGKNTMLINPLFGSYFFVGYILCDLDIQPDSPLKESCLGCGKCMKACPGNALSGGFSIDKCASHISQKKGVLTKEEESVLADSSLIFGCDICQQVCPHNNIEPQPMEDFTRDVIFSLTLDDILPLSGREFMRKYKDRAFSWRGRQVLLRNLQLLERLKSQ